MLQTTFTSLPLKKNNFAPTNPVPSKFFAALCSDQPITEQFYDTHSKSALHICFFPYTEKEDFNLLVSKTSWSSSSDRLNETSNEITPVRMTNHSSCSCQCKVKPSDCDNRTQRYSKENCRCDCIRGFMPCRRNYRWDPIKCQCICSPSNAVRAECTKRVEFDMESCRCTCSKKRCKNRAKVRDPKTCRCKCPRCPFGLKEDPQSCACTRAYRRRRQH